MVRRAKPEVARAQELQKSLPITCAALENALRMGGCPACQTLHQLEQRALFSFLYEGMMSGPARQEFLGSGGFCPRHFGLAQQVKRRLEGIGDFELAGLCRQLVPLAQKDLEAESAGRRRLGLRRRPAASRIPGRDCIFCRDMQRREQEIIDVLEGLIADERFAAGITSNGLCFPHARMAISAWRHTLSRQWLVAAMRQFTAELEADLKQFIRKHDVQQRHEPLEREADIVPRSVAFLVGLDGFTAP
jgi:hypothetical protein